MTIETLSVSLPTVDGLHLDADLASVPGARLAAVICHPHPLYGGNRFNPVVDALFRALPAAGVTALRFDFRGVGDSEGEHDGGGAERLDVAAAVDLLANATEAGIWAIGYSFGAIMALSTMHTSIDGWVGIAPPLPMLPSPPPCADDHRPVHLFLPRHDQFATPEVIEPIVSSWRSTTSTVVESADHFLAGHTAHVADLVLRAIT